MHRRSTPSARCPAAVLVAVCGLLLALSGCTGDPEPTGELPREQVAEEMAKLFARVSPDSEDAAGCFGDALAGRRTSSQLQEAGLLDEDGEATSQIRSMDRETATAWVESWFGCVDFVEVIGRAQARATKDLDQPAFEQCLRGELTDAELVEAVVDGLSGETGSDAVTRLSGAQADCSEQHS